MIDFASLVFHCVGSAITKQGDCAAHTAKTKRDDFQINLKSSLSFLDSTSNALFHYKDLKELKNIRSPKRTPILFYSFRDSYNENIITYQLLHSNH